MDLLIPIDRLFNPQSGGGGGGGNSVRPRIDRESETAGKLRLRKRAEGVEQVWG